MSTRWRIGTRRTVAAMFGLGMVVVIVALWVEIAMHLLHPSIGRHFVPIRAADTYLAARS